MLTPSPRPPAQRASPGRMRRGAALDATWLRRGCGAEQKGATHGAPRTGLPRGIPTRGRGGVCGRVGAWGRARVRECARARMRARVRACAHARCAR